MLLLFKCKWPERNAVCRSGNYHPQNAYPSFGVPKIPQFTGMGQIGLKCLQKRLAAHYLAFSNKPKHEPQAICAGPAAAWQCYRHHIAIGRRIAVRHCACSVMLEEVGV
jgi:hypothetical protein